MTLIRILFCAGGALLVLSSNFNATAADRETCLTCHKYRFMGRIDKDGKRWNYNVDETMYGNSLHRDVACQNCHTNITKLPHDPVPKAVNCANQCHIRLPFSGKYFSHKKIIKIYNSSVHAVRETDSAELKRAKPYCKFCHLNPLYTRVNEKVIAYDVTLRRCLNCHQKMGVTQAYRHITHRLRKKTSRSRQEIVKLCSKCHQDQALMKKLNVSPESLIAVETYKRSIHGKSITLGSHQTADCISCHATNALHDIYKKDNPKATIYKGNLIQTCRQCHAHTNNWFIKIAVHPNPTRETNPGVHFASIFFSMALYGSVFGMMGLLLLETYGRRKDGGKLMIRRGTTWRGKSKRRHRHKKTGEV